MAFNQVIIEGRLGFDAEERPTAQGDKVVTFRIANNENIKVNGETQQHTSWYAVSVWHSASSPSHLAGFAATLRKGDNVMVSGRIRIKTYKGRDQTDKTSVEIYHPTVIRLLAKLEGQPDATANPTRPEAGADFRDGRYVGDLPF